MPRSFELAQLAQLFCAYLFPRDDEIGSELWVKKPVCIRDADAEALEAVRGTTATTSMAAVLAAMDGTFQRASEIELSSSMASPCMASDADQNCKE